MWLDKLEELYKKNETVAKVITGIGLGTVVGMWAYGKYKESKMGKVVDKRLSVGKKIEELSQEIKNIKEEIE